MERVVINENNNMNYMNRGYIGSTQACTCYSCAICLVCIAFLPITAVLLAIPLASTIKQAQSPS